MAGSRCLVNLMFVISAVAAQSITYCITPLNELGSCISILRCASLRDLLENHKSNSSVINILRKSHCGFDGKYPNVCCPTPSKSTTTTTTTTTTTPITTSDLSDRISYQASLLSNKSKLPYEGSCGRSTVVRDRITDGETPNLAEWPWAVALGYKNKYKPNNPLQWSCGGTLITDRYVLTSGYCVVESGHTKLSVARLGDLNLNPNIDDGASPQDVQIEKTIAHESYDKRHYTNNIALLKLATSVKFNRHIQPICLPIAPKLRSKLFVNYTPTIIGWGTTQMNGPLSDALMEAGLPIVDNLECNRSYAKFPVTIDNRVICAGYAKGGKGSCQGDSGNTLMIPQSGQYYSIGIVSFGYKCGEPGYPGVYTRVTYFIDWILDTISKS